MGVQMNVVQRLGEVQQEAFSQAVEATKEPSINNLNKLNNYRGDVG